MDELISDIQGYLREETQRKLGERMGLPATAAISLPKRRAAGPIFLGMIMLLSACAVGSLTVAILLLAAMGGPVHEPARIIWLLAAGGCGIFFSTALVSSWKRLIILRQIEKNTRLILVTRRETNTLLEEFIRNVD